MLASSLLSTLGTLSASVDPMSGPWDQPGGQHRDAAFKPIEASMGLGFTESYGNDRSLLGAKIERLASLCRGFIDRFGDGQVRALRAPARINILGEHVDYVAYLPTGSLTFGSREHDMIIMFRPSPTGRVRGGSTDPCFEDFEFEIQNDNGPSPQILAPALAGWGEPVLSDHDRSHEQTTNPGSDGSGRPLLESRWLDYLYCRPAPAPGWQNYVIGACRFARLKYGERIDRGFDFLIDSSIPAGSGASSSSALCVLAGAAVRIQNDVKFELPELAMDSARAEWYVGTRGGSMDHITICGARPDSAINISYSSGQSTIVPMPSAGYSWITFFSHPANKGHEVMNQYNERAFVSRILIPAILNDWRSTNPELSQAFVNAVGQLDAVHLDGIAAIENVLGQLPECIELREISKSYPAAFNEALQAFPGLVSSNLEADFTVRKRALHHAGEAKRVARAGQVLESAGGREGNTSARADTAMRMLGELLNESHSSLRDLYEVSTEDVDGLVGIISGSRLAYGARMMGAGFGGNVLALSAEANTRSLIDLVQRTYYLTRDRDGLKEGSIMVSKPGFGLSEIHTDDRVDKSRQK
jgi:galactokinase